MSNIHSYIRDEQNRYRNEDKGPEIIDGLYFPMFARVKKIVYYIYGEFIKGSRDSNKKTKPWFDIINRIRVNSRVLTSRDLGLTAPRKKYRLHAFLLNIANRNWMTTDKFGTTLNKMTQIDGDFGGIMLEKTEDDEELHIDTVEWITATVDPLDISGGSKVFTQYYTPSQLLETKDLGWGKGDFDGAIEDAIRQHTEKSQKDDDPDSNEEDRETMGYYIKVHKVDGVLPDRLFADYIDMKEYLQTEGKELDEDGEIPEHAYSHWVCYTANSEQVKKNSEQKGDVTELGSVLWCGTMERDEQNYKYKSYEHSYGRDLGVGDVERSMPAQMWTNYLKKQERDAMDLATKVVVQSSSKNSKLKGKNLLTQFKTGTVLEHAPGSPMSKLELTPASLAHFQNLAQAWKVQLEDANSTHAINTGGQTPANMPFRLGAVLNQEANKPFDQKRQEMGLFLEEVWRDWVIPFLVEQLKKSNELLGELTLDEMKMVDKLFSEWRADAIISDKYLNGEYDNLSPAIRWTVIKQEHAAIISEVKKELKKEGKRRAFNYPENFWEGVEVQLEMGISNEQRIKQVFLETVTNIMQLYLANREVINNDPKAAKMYNDLMEFAGYSPLNLEAVDMDEGNEQNTPKPEDQKPQVELPVENQETPVQ